MSETGTCVGDPNSPAALIFLRVLGAASGMVGGGYGSYLAWNALPNSGTTPLIISVIFFAAIGRKCGTAIGECIYKGGASAIQFFKNCRNDNGVSEKSPMLEMKDITEQTEKGLSLTFA